LVVAKAAQRQREIEADFKRDKKTANRGCFKEQSFGS
jgi:hypothetical protein